MIRVTARLNEMSCLSAEEASHIHCHHCHVNMPPALVWQEHIPYEQPSQFSKDLCSFQPLC